MAISHRKVAKIAPTAAAVNGTLLAGSNLYIIKNPAAVDESASSLLAAVQMGSRLDRLGNIVANIPDFIASIAVVTRNEARKSVAEVKSKITLMIRLARNVRSLLLSQAKFTTRSTYDVRVEPDHRRINIPAPVAASRPTTISRTICSRVIVPLS